ncbi:NADPH-dependent 2,4-dienoyl-CoA reductase/sulfur reductase-like enzyme [Rhizobium sp. PP-F2F-G38]|uniref:2Fe-2S iron-sulfur cluster-binding protein n=1 Tax=Rhizobium sp. PP-CC-3G-465 TaxID=2135648 RepID=UPI000D94542A|nr:NADPH-dependent 2,4-dienoyl-CoA reductase/sulfur reductase-like enzyme [Rhizobium sp. PP-WC-1G-195]PYE92995.1 NADPH-dependent 2,4-dienoyl-CoA reductase/sulfur reductase-like enzyme [Rhizobium sp. PP-F2F-G38]TCP79067.1 NADPH-dependent 2,4-dienoyl-CoA reductase/sulfur reductase-like enzyme [Rhizobium sp. PP-CC-2G-626]TCQ15935.1 NADPH-dependent 2,4-dienoyl-CoA reductase/sulfur reductase-like enzyme [Rhizobium sp. PP-CC-3G-465]
MNGNKQVEVTFLWNGSRIKALQGDSVAAALWREGITTLARSRKIHRPLGYSGSYPTGVLARVNGRPNVRLDQVSVEEGLVAEMQNTWPSPRFDLLKLAQIVPEKAVYGGFEHGAWMPKSGLAYRIAERAMANLAGVARPADATGQGRSISGERMKVDCLVVGGGPAGINEANRRAARGETVSLVTRGDRLARFAGNVGAVVAPLDPQVRLFSGMELFGIYRGGALMVAAPHDNRHRAVVFDPRTAVLATGRRSMPPLVRGNQLPGVLDAHAAIQLVAVHRVMPGRRVAVLGTGAETEITERLASLGVNIVHCGPIEELIEIKGRSRVTAICVCAEVQCDAVIHAGPWRIDPSLGFQASGEGMFQMQGHPLPSTLSVVGAAGLGDERIAASKHLHPGTLICPCMDVTAGELYCHIDEGEMDPEVLKRLTSCGMGTCQGFPCWEHMLALLAARVGVEPDMFARPTHRPPRRSITVAQAAGLAGLVEPDR